MSKGLSQKEKRLLIELEKIMGQCFNPRSRIYYGRDYEEGQEFNYPVTYIQKDGSKTKYPGCRHDTPNERVLMTGYYAFGVNQLPVFRNLKRMLDYLEKNYGLALSDPEQRDKETDN